jgi:uncharacterized protein YbjT (DUF2867 family)
VSLVVLFTESRAVTVSTFAPAWSSTVADQLVVPLATPDPPRLVLHVTCVTRKLSLAQPLTATEATVVLNVVADVGPVIAILGGTVSETENPTGSAHPVASDAIAQDAAPAASGIPGLTLHGPTPLAQPAAAGVTLIEIFAAVSWSPTSR